MDDLDALNASLLMLRVIVGLVILAHGWKHLERTVKGQGVAEWFESIGVRPGELQAWTVSLTELFAGTMLVVGLLTPLAAGAVAALMLVAFVTNHRKAGFWVYNRPTEGWEYVILVMIVSIAIGGLGPGDWSLDDGFDLMIDPLPGLAWSAGLGIGGGIAFLLMFWRPQSGESA
jgi:putative oxidoreductase